MIGMLWFDNDPKRSLEEKVEFAAAYYEKKYGRKPTLIAASKKNVTEATTVDGIQVKPVTGLLNHHFLVRHDPYE